MSRTRRAALGGLTTVMQFAVQASLQALIYPVLLRVAGASTLGAYSMLQQILGYFALSDLGFGIAISRGLAQASVDGPRGPQFQKLLAAGRTIYLGSGILYCALCLSVIPLLGSSHLQLPPEAQTDARHALLLFGTWSIVRAPAALAIAGMQALQRLAEINLVGVLTSMGRLALSITLTLRGWGLFGLAVATISMEFLSLGWASLRLHQGGSRERFALPDRALLHDLSSFGLRALGMSVAVKVIFVTDSLVVGILSGSAAAGAYYATQIPALFAASAIWALQDNSAPGINDLVGRREQVRLRAVTLQLLQLTFMIALPFISGVVLFNRILVSSWVGPGLYAGTLLTWSLAGFVGLAVIQHLQSLVLQALGDLRVFVWLLALEAIVNFALSILLGRKLGPGGVMLASLVATVFTVVWAFLRVLRLLDISLAEAWNRVLRPSLVVGGSATAAALVCRLLSPSPSLALAGFLACGGGSALLVGDREMRFRVWAIFTRSKA